jgi:hypothetical protein
MNPPLDVFKARGIPRTSSLELAQFWGIFLIRFLSKYFGKATNKSSRCPIKLEG